jgi:hypothetical protein
MTKYNFWQFEGVFRKPRLWSNQELQKIAPLFSGSVINISAGKDLDKSVNQPLRYFFTNNFDEGNPYYSYFVNASNYTITNYPNDKTIKINKNKIQEIDLDLEEDLPTELVEKYDVVFNHTSLEHIFDVFKAFSNLCKISKDTVIIVVPFVQQVHDYGRGYKDYWRFTPFALDKLFEINGFTVLHRASSRLWQSSIYYLYVASKNPEKWKNHFSLNSLEEDIKTINKGETIFPIARFQIKLEFNLRSFGRFVRKILNKIKKSG